MPIYKRCDTCGRRLPPGTVCPCRERRRAREYDKHCRDRDRDKFYHSEEWRRMRQEVMDRDGGMDMWIFRTEGTVVAAEIVHHIVELKDDWGRRLDMSNLVSLSTRTHIKIHELYKTDKEGTQAKLFDILRN